MRVTIVTVGDELLAGDVENSNATWLADQLTDRGVDVTEITVVPDAVERIADTVAEASERWDAVVVTGGLGSTPDDVTVEGVAAGLGVETERDERTYQQVATAVDEIREEHPEFEFDLERAALRPAGSEPIRNDQGIAPGFVCENVFVIPGIPSEMKTTFEQVLSEFDGEQFSKTLYSTEAESHLNDVLRRVRSDFDVEVGCYPDEDKRRKRVKVTASDPSDVEAATNWLSGRSEISNSE